MARSRLRSRTALKGLRYTHGVDDNDGFDAGTAVLPLRLNRISQCGHFF